MLPNGTIIINTGLIAITHTEDELAAAIAHELAHSISNHSMLSIIEAQKRAARAEFWAAFATAIAGVAEVVAAANDVYFDGSLIAATAITSTSIAVSALEHMGLNYERKQEEEADEMAYNAINYAKYDPQGLSTLFYNMKKSYESEGNIGKYYASGDHPSLQSRMEKSGNFYLRHDIEYERKISFAVTSAAINKYKAGKFSQAIVLADQNIKNNVGSDDDYIIKAQCLLNTQNTDESNHEAYGLIQIARELNPGNINALRAEIVAAMRIYNYSDALNCTKKYMETLRNNMEEVGVDSRYFTLYDKEYEWARKMETKIKGMM